MEIVVKTFLLIVMLIDSVNCCKAQRGKEENLLSITTKNVDVDYRYLYDKCGQVPVTSTVNKGYKVEPHRYPWQVWIIIDSEFGPSSCGGSIITEKFVMTAAHCLFNKNESRIDLEYDRVYVTVGTHNKDTVIKEFVNDNLDNIIEISDYKLYPGYNEANDFNKISDVAILTLNQTLSFDERVQPICIDLSSISDYSGETATIAGWGVNSDNITSKTLMAVDIQVMTNSDCKNDWRFIDDFHLCTHDAHHLGRSHCHGDSGGALFLRQSGRYTAIAVASFGISYVSRCGQLPGGFARLTPAVLSWISKATYGLLVAGGSDGSSLLDVVEMINLETNSSCIVDVKLDVPRVWHIGDGDMVCGGLDDDYNTLSSCYNIVTGTTISLNNNRAGHLSWSRANGQETYMIGGNSTYNLRTTELITGDSTQAGFELQYDTVHACGFADDDDTYIITGGQYTPTTVSRYDKNGWMEDLPSLNTGRYSHGCGTYLDDVRDRIYLVTGGFGGGNDYHSSTEMMVKGATSWTEVPDSFPARMDGLRRISVNNQIITTGGWDADAEEDSDKILMFNKDSRKFEQIGKLEHGRSWHSMSLVSLGDYTCQS